jgi:protease-4
MVVEATFIDELSRLRQRHAAPLILELDLSEGIAEEPPGGPVSAVLAMRRPRLADVLDGLRRARADDKVRALVVKIGGRPIGFARIQELRSAVAEFRRSGKATVAWAETYGEFGPGNAAYYLATAFERIWLQPSGDVGLTGLSLEQWFLRGTLDKLGLEYEVSKRHEYKTAADRLTEQGFTGPAREALQQLASSLTGQITDAVAERLAIPPAQARELIDNGPYVAEEALELRLVDALGYRDEVYDDVRKSAGPETHLLYLGRYQRSRALAERARKLPEPAADMIALIYAAGPIRRGRSGRGPRRPTGGCARSCCGSTARAAPTWPRTPSGARWSGPARRAPRSSCPWATWPLPAAITSRWRPTRSSRSRARSPARSACSPANR